MDLTRHYSNPVALAFACPPPPEGCGAPPGTNCSDDKHDRDGHYRHWMHAARVALVAMPATREEWQERARQIRANVGAA